ncbi:MAG: DUF6580 family putative transport protein [Pseudobdellovibrionaceae bacterium]
MAQLVTIILMILAAAFSRLIPHPWNFTAIGAMALFGGAYLPSKKLSLLIPVAALFLSDFILSFHLTMVFVYLSFMLIVLLGWTLREKRNVVRLGVLSLVASTLFFVVSNFGVWITQDMYPVTWQGLVQCYVAAIPFFDNQVYGDLFFSALLFGSFEAVKKYAPEFFVTSAVK